MAEEGTTTAGTATGAEGQPQAGPGESSTTGSTGTPDGSSGQPGGTGTTDQGTQAEDTFFDPNELDPALMPAYKNMQRAFTKRMQDAAKHKHKIEAYDAFERDPVGSIQAMAQRMGYSLTRAEAAQQLREQQSGTNQAPWEPQSWDEVLTRAKDMAKQELMQQMGPVVNEVKNLRKTNLETFLDSNAPDWREHEDSMMDNLRRHPTLVNDPIQLYRLSVPTEVLESRAMQKALKRMEDKVKGTQVSGGSTTTRKAPAGVPDKAVSFDEAVKYAEQKLAEEGIQKPGR